MTQPAQSKTNGAKPHQEMISGAYLRNAWYVAAWSDGVGDGQLVPRTIMDEPIVLYRKADGAVARIASRRCTWARSSAATVSNARITAWNTTAAAPACAIRTAPRTSRRG